MSTRNKIRPVVRQKPKLRVVGVGEAHDVVYVKRRNRRRLWRVKAKVWCGQMRRTGGMRLLFDAKTIFGVSGPMDRRHFPYEVVGSSQVGPRHFIQIRHLWSREVRHAEIHTGLETVHEAWRSTYRA
jgi:hypothetical protein